MLRSSQLRHRAAARDGDRIPGLDKRTRGGRVPSRRRVFQLAGACVIIFLGFRLLARPRPIPRVCHSADLEIPIRDWVEPPKRIPVGAEGSVLITPARLEQLAAAGKLEALPSGVTKVIHQTWPAFDATSIASHYKKWSASWGACHPGWYHVLWDDCDIRRLFATHLPDFLPVYDAYPNPVQRADIFRCLVTKVYGGVYVDMDYECSGGLDVPTGLNPPKPNQCGVYIVNSPDPEHDGILQNAFMASVPAHPYWDKVFELAVERRSTLAGRIFGEIPIYNTGPGLVSDAYTALPEESKAQVCGLNATEFSGQAIGWAKYAIHRNAGSWCACRFPLINFPCWRNCKKKMKKYVPSMYRDLLGMERKISAGKTLSSADQVMWDTHGKRLPLYKAQYGEIENI